MTTTIGLGPQGQREGFGGADGVDDVLFKDDDLVWAIGRPITGGEKYRLTQDRYMALVQCVNFARRRARATYDFLQGIERDVSSKTLVTANGSLTGAGVLAEHFNLTKAMKLVEDDVWGGNWHLRSQAKPPSCSGGDLRLLFNKVKTVAELTALGLEGRILLRGLKPNKGSADNVVGVVRLRFAENKNVRERGADTKSLQQTTKYKKGLFETREVFRKMPALKDDKVFATKEAAAKGNMHLDYGRTPAANNVLAQERNAPPMPWIIVHEATHKFARTDDCNGGACYSAADCRNMHWGHAARNATHYERFMGIDWNKAPESDRSGDWTYKFSKMRATP